MAINVDWLILVLVAPLIIVIVVLLYGFVGCGFEGVGTGPSKKDAAPSLLTATAIGTNTIELQWQDNAGGAATSFKVERFEAGSFIVIDPKGISPFQDFGRNDGTDFTYRVTAVLFGRNYESDPSNEATATTHPNPPSNLILTPQDVDEIDLAWDHISNSNKDIQFLLEHRLTAGGSWNTFAIIGKSKVSNHTTYNHKDAALLTPGSAHEYRVTAIAVAGFVPHASNTPVPSTPVTGSANTWTVAFKAGLTDDQGGLEGFCLVQKISKTLLQSSGTKVKITVRGASAGELTINRIYISQVAPSGNPYDSLGSGSAGGLTKVVDKDDGDPAVTLGAIPSPFPDRTARQLGPITYTIPDPPTDLLIAFDISASAGQGNVRSVLLPGTGTVHYFQATEQAKVPNRSPGFTPGLDRLYLVELIEVL